MKKSLILLPLAAAVLSGCMLLPGKKTSSGSSSGGTSGSGSSGSTQPTVEPTPSEAVDFVLSSGTHTAVLDFENNPDGYTYPRAEQGDTQALAGEFGGLHWNIYHSYKGQYTDEKTGVTSYWLMMKNKDNWDATSQAWFGNTDSLGSITSIEVTVRSGASTKLSYDLSVGSTAYTSAQTTGTEFAAGTKGTYSGSGKGFFAVSTRPISGTNKYNGQIARITVTYTIS